MLDLWVARKLFALLKEMSPKLSLLDFTIGNQCAHLIWNIPTLFLSQVSSDNGKEPPISAEALLATYTSIYSFDDLVAGIIPGVDRSCLEDYITGLISNYTKIIIC